MTSYIILTLFLTLAPNILLFIFIYNQDDHPEPKSLVLRMALHGAAIGAGGALVWGLFFKLLFPVPPDPLWGAAYKAFVLAAIPEELFKMAAIFMVAYNHPAFDEPFDGIIYGAASSLGFATLENFLYVSTGGLHIAALRAVSAVPLHAFLGVIMGYHLGRAKFAVHPIQRRYHTYAAFLYPMVYHGVYDWGIMSMPVIGHDGALLSFFILVMAIAYGRALISEMKEKNLFYLSQYLRLPQQVLEALLEKGERSEPVLLQYLEQLEHRPSELDEETVEMLHQVAQRESHPRGVLGLVYVFGGVVLVTLGLLIVLAMGLEGFSLYVKGRQMAPLESILVGSALGLFTILNGLLLFIKGMVRGTVPTRPTVAKALISVSYVVVTLLSLALLGAVLQGMTVASGHPAALTLLGGIVVFLVAWLLGMSSKRSVPPRRR